MHFVVIYHIKTLCNREFVIGNTERITFRNSKQITEMEVGRSLYFDRKKPKTFSMFLYSYRNTCGV